MTTKTKTAAAKQPGPRRTFRAWLVTNPAGDDGKPLWTEVTGLWPTKTGSGLSGPVTKPLPMTSGGRLVILPATVRQPDQPA